MYVREHVKLEKQTILLRTLFIKETKFLDKPESIPLRRLRHFLKIQLQRSTAFHNIISIK